MKLQKITEPRWLGMIGPRINEYVKFLKEQHISYESLFTYLAMSIQGGRREPPAHDVSEFWVVNNEGKPKAFAHWFVRPVPHIGKVYMDGIYSWAKTPRVVSMLIDEFLEFGKRHRCSIYEADCINEKVFDIIEKYVNEKGYDFKNTGSIHAIGRKRRE